MAEPSGSGLTRGLSLERKLPLLITALLVVTMAAGVAFGYEQLRKEAVTAARDRLRLVARQLSTLAVSGIGTRRATVAAAAADPAVSAFLAAPSDASRAKARAALQKLLVPLDSTQLVMLWDRERRTVLSVGAVPPGAGAGSVPPGSRGLPDTAAIGRFVTIGARSYYLLASPVRGAAAGTVAELRAVGSRGAARQVQALLGDGIAIYYANTGGGSWIALDGNALPAPAAWPFSDAVQYRSRGGRATLANAAAMPGTPWSIVAEEPLAVALARPNGFLYRSGGAAALLCLLGAAGAWLLSRSITRPLRELGAATDAISRGDYAQRVESRRSDELGVLAGRFDVMAAQVQEAHQALSREYETAQSLAMELEMANLELESAVAEADTARAEAETANRTKSDFLATMSHEIRTPINAIIGYTELLELGTAGPVSGPQLAHLERIRVSGRHLVGLVDQVLDFARIEAGSLRVERRASSAASAAETALTVVRPQAERKGVELRAGCAADGALRYAGDPQRVEQILVNLLSNAIKFTAAGGSATLACDLHDGALPGGGRAGRWVRIRVEDTGAGIDLAQQERIFEPFVQVESGYTRRHEGTGLGLAISRRFARSMGGDLTVESEPGRGSCFTLWLPAAPDAPDALR